MFCVLVTPDLPWRSLAPLLWWLSAPPWGSMAPSTPQLDLFWCEVAPFGWGNAVTPPVASLFTIPSHLPPLRRTTFPSIPSDLHLHSVSHYHTCRRLSHQALCKNSQAVFEMPYYHTFTFTFSHLADAFIQSDLQLGNT